MSKRTSATYTLLLILLFCKEAKAQKDSVRIKSIPYGMFWENRAQKFSATNDGMVMVAGEKTDMFRDPSVTYNTDNAPKLLFHPDKDFVLTASIEHAFASKWDGGAIVLKQDIR